MAKLQRKSFRVLFGGCNNGANVTVPAPLRIPRTWTRVLRLTQPPKVPIEEFIQHENRINAKNFCGNDNTRLSVKDGKGRTAAHQAAARNKVNILQFIRDQQG
uniref:Uncharacterized protein n=1 Tax=Phlebotomus papatasi TaxID=29031 RepID=A0A1B0D278_PHLPP